MGAERERVDAFGKLEDGLRQAGDWYLWGPYVSERQWGTVREDYSADGEAWDYLPHDHARSRAYRWGEDGLAGFCDIEQRLCLGLALWNGRDPILKERAVRADRRRGQPRRGRQGVLVVPRRRAQPRLEPLALPLPAGAPSRTRTCVAENGRRGKLDPEYELLDTGAFDDDRYWIVEVHYAKADPRRPADDGAGDQRRPGRRHPARAADRLVPQHLVVGRRQRPARAGGDRRRRRSRSQHPFLGELELLAGPGPDGARADALFCENETNVERLYGVAAGHAVPEGRHQRPRRGRARPPSTPTGAGTKCAFWYRLTVPPGATVELRLRLRPAGSPGRAGDRAGTRTSTRWSPGAGPRPTSSTPS